MPLAIAGRRLLAAAEKLQQSLKADIHAVKNLCTAWNGYVAKRRPAAFLESIAPAHKGAQEAVLPPGPSREELLDMLA
jgi:hypothetical protein